MLHVVALNEQLPTPVISKESVFKNAIPRTSYQECVEENLGLVSLVLLP